MMTDKEIAQLMRLKWCYSTAAMESTDPEHAGWCAMWSVKIIHHIINSINWED